MTLLRGMALADSANALHQRPFVFYLTGLGLLTFAVQIISVAVGWQIYDLTRQPLYLGLVGLAQFLPGLLLVLVTGLVADKFNRRLVIGTAVLIEALCALGLVLFARSGSHAVWPIFATLVAFGTVRAFMNPAADALAPNLLPKAALAHGISLKTMAWQISTIGGPVAGGLLYGLSGAVAYGVAMGLMLAALICMTLVGHVPQENHAAETNIGTLLAGFSFIRSEPIVLGAISLDLFAVLLGGATALLPVYARDILEVGPWGLGLLRAGPGLGAIAMGLWLSQHPIRDKAGLILFGFVAAFGVFTVVFGVSTSVPLSIVALAVMGACDMVSVYVRETLLQLWTPDNVRGRVLAVNQLFIGTSNEMGEFRAGLMAAWLGAVTAVTIGGAGTVVVAALWSRWFPALLRARRLDGRLDGRQ